MPDRKKEIAKFACGAEAAHALFHAVLLISGTPLTVFGITAIPAWNLAAVVINGVISGVLGIYAWRSGSRSAS